MRQHLPVLIVFLPLAGALLGIIVGRIREELGALTVIAFMAGSFWCAVQALPLVLSGPPMHYSLAGWGPPIGIEYVLDPLSGGLAVLTTFVGLLVAIYAWPQSGRDYSGRRAYLYSLYGLLACGLLGMVITGDMFNLYVHLEISSLAVYALIAAGGNRATVASFRYVILGTLGGTFYLLGVGYLYAVTGTLNMADLARALNEVGSSRAVVLAIALIASGLGIKMALFPMHGWMPDAYTYSPAGITAFIAGIMSKVAAFALFRILFFVLGGPVVRPALTLLGILAATAIIGGSVMAVAQKDLRRMLAYSSVAQIGYIVLGFSLGNTAGITGSLLHILNHAVMKACLFLVAGGVAWRVGSTRIDRLLQASRALPWTMAAFVVAALSMIGLPPTAGFFSKLYLIRGSIDAGWWPFVVVIVASSLLNAVYFFRIIERVYLRKPKEEQPVETKSGGLELPALMLAPIVIFGAGIIVLGVFSERIVSGLIQIGLPEGL